MEGFMQSQPLLVIEFDTTLKRYLHNQEKWVGSSILDNWHTERKVPECNSIWTEGSKDIIKPKWYESGYSLACLVFLKEEIRTQT